FFFQAEGGIRDRNVTGVQTCALPISNSGWFFVTFCSSPDLVVTRLTANLPLKWIWVVFSTSPCLLINSIPFSICFVAVTASNPSDSKISSTVLYPVGVNTLVSFVTHFPPPGRPAISTIRPKGSPPPNTLSILGKNKGSLSCTIAYSESLNTVNPVSPANLLKSMSTFLFCFLFLDIY